MAKPNITTKRKEREEKEDAEDGLKFVIDGAKLQCDLCTVPVGDLKVNYDTPSIQDKRVATIVEKDNSSLIFNGKCKKSPNSSSPCASVMKLADWKNVGTVYFQDESPLLLRSTIKCEYGGTDIKITDCGQRNVIEKIDTTGAPVPSLESIVYVNGYFYTKQGIYLGKIGSDNNVYITDKSTFNELEKGKNVEKEKIIYFTEKSELNNERFLNRANWVFGEGGGAFADRYAMTIKNLKLAGRSGYGPKPFTSDEEMYTKTMSHGNPPKTLYPNYLNGTYKGANAQAFALAKRDPTDLNKNNKMNIAIEAVINSFLKENKNEGYVAWRGSGDQLYSESEKEIENKKSGVITKDKLSRKDGKVYGFICSQKDHFWESIGSKYRRHSFIKIWNEKV
ncbi:DUF4280 domain-containing protein [Flavobacterium sp. WLB]|uniref:DUF4280 domain-containing protein n=1 Tax=unclassified Flavobacterium TaxID=196869 RepID=UPI0006AB7F26|nr:MULTISPECIES: DUF4280 domain-containing protein [unclassified Flavobacterium]KOP39804.1 hypothetical protein AKO67_02665 [Flavobacterium sp. VMW]OWU92592.1 hypothetical protein APR43_00585 [Flavobacterium sp. NLM]PUU67844.1 DUF4280 domain-containing protein [Flavobacterium sp. WLB]